MQKGDRRLLSYISDSTARKSALLLHKGYQRSISALSVFQVGFAMKKGQSPSDKGRAVLRVKEKDRQSNSTPKPPKDRSTCLKRLGRPPKSCL